VHRPSDWLTIYSMDADVTNDLRELCNLCMD